MAFALLFERDIGDTAPAPHRTPSQNHATLLVSWWCTIFSLVIILTRVVGRYVRTERLFREDKVMALSIIPLLIRMALVDVIMLYGTNNTTLGGLSQEEIYHRSIGSRLVLASRIFYALLYELPAFSASQAPVN